MVCRNMSASTCECARSRNIDLETEYIVQGLIARTLPKAEWTHDAHLRAGLWHALHYQDELALELLRERIRALNLATGVANTTASGYHETVTRFYLHMIRRFLGSTNSERAVDALAAELIARYGDRGLPLRYYTPQRLFSILARTSWVEPDLQPLPSGDGCDCGAADHQGLGI
jgi:hypothetical protein